MQRLTLILSDLYLPNEAGVLPRALELPALDGLLRFAASRRVDDWRSWLARDLGLESIAAQSIAQTASRAVPGFDAPNPWLATPVRLEARLDHVRLADRGLLRFGAVEAARWCAEFGRVFGPQYRLHAGHAGALVLEGVASGAAQSVDPARLLDSDIGAALPSGDAAGELRRLGAEIEMWLHGSPLNGSRRPPVSALWLWGGGVPQSVASRDTAAAARAPLTASPRFFGEDLFLAGLALHCAGASRAPAAFPAAPAHFEALSGVSNAIVELAPMSGPESQSLHALETAWFAPLRTALAEGSVQSCDILVNDRCFEVGARSRWKFWKPRRPWLEQLGQR